MLFQDEGYVCEEAKPLPVNHLQRKLWLLLEYPESSLGARLMALLSVSIILLSIVVFCIETLPQFSTSTAATVSPSSSNLTKPADDAPTTTVETVPDVSRGLDLGDPFFLIETICIVWFTSELLLRFSAAPSRVEFARNIMNVIDLVAVLPYFITLVPRTSSLSPRRSLASMVAAARTPCRSPSFASSGLSASSASLNCRVTRRVFRSSVRRSAPACESSVCSSFSY